MIVFGGVRRELDNGCCLLKDLAAAVEDEVVMRGDFGEGNGEGGAVSLGGDLVVFPVRAATFRVRSLAEVGSCAKNSSKRPQPGTNERLIAQRYVGRIRKENFCFPFQRPIAHLIAFNNWAARIWR